MFTVPNSLRAPQPKSAAIGRTSNMLRPPTTKMMAAASAPVQRDVRVPGFIKKQRQFGNSRERTSVINSTVIYNASFDSLEGVTRFENGQK